MDVYDNNAHELTHAFHVSRTSLLPRPLKSLHAAFDAGSRIVSLPRVMYMASKRRGEKSWSYPVLIRNSAVPAYHTWKEYSVEQPELCQRRHRGVTSMTCEGARDGQTSVRLLADHHVLGESNGPGRICWAPGSGNLKGMGEVAADFNQRQLPTIGDVMRLSQNRLHF
ncbi:hypothetical protein BOTBODRAFT_32977 [Botryobasidium botryosum FD-172 SS1]|uniref:Uncharacterized protein n=1 Tax=Botryobasidium botryosum (strain FD-172 SS1) TaxID=930990 RepID=A0A067MRH0_BOTB1|nr:hypothetical protein BOTBODRAFT_32977 [Botryobasidium botryosum FD-172 SS1]